MPSLTMTCYACLFDIPGRTLFLKGGVDMEERRGGEEDWGESSEGNCCQHAMQE